MGLTKLAGNLLSLQLWGFDVSETFHFPVESLGDGHRRYWYGLTLRMWRVLVGFDVNVFLGEKLRHVLCIEDVAY